MRELWLRVMKMAQLKLCWSIWGVLCQKQVTRAGPVNYVPQYLWDVIICSCLWYLLLAQHSSYDMEIILNSLALNITVASQFHRWYTPQCLTIWHSLVTNNNHITKDPMWHLWAPNFTLTFCSIWTMTHWHTTTSNWNTKVSTLTETMNCLLHYVIIQRNDSKIPYTTSNIIFKCTIK